MIAKQQRASFRQYIPSPDTPRIAGLAACDARQWAEKACDNDFMRGWKAHWESLAAQPYKGITTDGNVVEDLFHLNTEINGGDYRINLCAAATRVVEEAGDRERERLLKGLNAEEWRYWANPEIYIYRHGIRLDEISDELCEAVFAVIRASLSERGYAKARGCMKVNHFLGDIVNGRKVLNERSYNFCIFGKPSMTEPWGWQIFGHHFCMNFMIVGDDIVVSPIFMGAEPNVIDEGPDKGLELFTDQEQLAMRLMSSMEESSIKAVRIFHALSGPEYPPGRFHRADQRHLGGAFQDNRHGPQVVDDESQSPSGSRIELQLRLIDKHWNETYFAWIGGWGDQDAFYYKVHSPAIMIEFDHHSGVFLTNKDALPFHIHTIVRTPNGNDYGKALLRQYFAKRGVAQKG
ncbi:uncharacterized protein AB675_10789 [Cyphellophora attinorum]|uniref:DUF3500 domain-containing protein n=1 Tax=Cyphellophora attinorum TaxID=1664694 RepID=A0A0N0NMN1_9EURO|nr:uncharacterized protein AB675_10789 [Phialophora attinorum]KPI40651.1 hypothetical protein AB675_10789 [Phialophora attinorum]